MTLPLQTSQTIWGAAKETTVFTPVNPSTSDQFFMVKNMKPSDEADEIVDNGYRGLMTEDFESYQGFRSAKLSFDLFAYPVPLGTAFMGIFGADGWTLGSTHPFTVAAAFPPSYTFSDFYGVAGSSTRRYAGHYFETVDISYASTGELKVSCTTMGEASPAQTLAVKPTAVFDSSLPFLPYENVATINNVANSNLIAFQAKFARKVEVNFGANGTQDPTSVSVGPLGITGKLTFRPADDTELNYYENATKITPNTFVFTSGANSLTIAMTQMRLIKPTIIDRSTHYAKVSAAYRAVYNATDGGPGKVTLVGGKSGGAY